MQNKEGFRKLQRFVIKILLLLCVIYLVSVFSFHAARAIKESRGKSKFYNSIRKTAEQVKISLQNQGTENVSAVGLPAEPAKAVKKYPRGSYAIWITGEDFKSVPDVEHVFANGSVYRTYKLSGEQIEYIVIADLKKLEQETHEFNLYRETTGYGNVKDTGQKEKRTLWTYLAKVWAIEVKTGNVLACEQLDPGPLPSQDALDLIFPTEGKLLTPEKISFRVVGNISSWFGGNYLDENAATSQPEQTQVAIAAPPRQSYVFIVIMIAVVLIIFLAQGV